MEYMYKVYNFDAASYEPHHEKICLRGLRPGRRHKMGCTATEASWRLEFGIKERTYVTLSSHLHNKQIKTAYNMECKVYRVSKKNDATFNRYLFLYFNLNWYAFNIYYSGNQYPLRISN